MAWIDENLSANNHGFDTVGGFLQAVLEDVFRDELEMSSAGLGGPDGLGAAGAVGLAEALELPSQLTRRVDALYLLSLLLTGSQRSRVQEVLAKLGIGPLLSALFEQFLWKYGQFFVYILYFDIVIYLNFFNRPSTTRHTTDHANQCNCSPVNNFE